MRRWLPVAALVLVIAVAGIAVALLTARGPTPTRAERSAALAAELRCPDCQGLSVADSPTASAREIRRQIDELVAGGAADQAVRDHFVARYGDWILLAPSSPLPWLVPLAVVVAGAAGLVVWLAGRRRPTAAPSALTPEQRRSLHEEVEALDA